MKVIKSQFSGLQRDGDFSWWQHLPTIEQSSAGHRGIVEDYRKWIFISVHETPRKLVIPPVIGWRYLEDEYCWECGKDLPNIDPNGDPKTTIWETGLEELLEGWSRTMSYVGCVVCRKVADRWT